MIKWSVLKINMQRKKGATSVNYKTENLFFIEDENKLEKKRKYTEKNLKAIEKLQQMIETSII